jgi:hypothetical protein
VNAPPGKGAGPLLEESEPGRATKHDDAEGITNVGTIQTGENAEQFDAQSHAVQAVRQ